MTELSGFFICKYLSSASKALLLHVAPLEGQCLVQQVIRMQQLISMTAERYGQLNNLLLLR